MDFKKIFGDGVMGILSWVEKWLEGILTLNIETKSVK